MGSIFCSKCGVESPEDKGFCSKCGTALFSTTATVQPAEPPATDSPEVTPKKAWSINWGKTMLGLSVFCAFWIVLAIISPDLNCGLKIATGLDLAGLLDASKSAANYCD